jgi:hypothetical protein
MKTLFIIITSFGLVFSGICDSTNEPAKSLQPQSEADISQKIVGTWIFDSSTNNLGEKLPLPITGTETFSSNGVFVAKLVNAKLTKQNGGKEQVKTYNGTWRIHNETLAAWVIDEQGQRGLFMNPKVAQVDDNELITYHEKGNVYTIMKRIK